MTTFATIDALRSQLGAKTPAPTPDGYAEKMLHKVPAAPVVDREKFILELCAGKRVLEFGASGPLHDAIVKVAASVIGVDRVDSEGVIGFDLDDVGRSWLPPFLYDAVESVIGESYEEAKAAHDAARTFDVIVCGEVLEHLSNPGWFLSRLKAQYGGIPTIITVPNAFSAAGQAHMTKGIENVNRDHVSWYSYKTLSTLLERAGYTQRTFAWYKGQPLTAEGLLVLTE